MTKSFTPMYRCAINADTGEIMDETVEDANDYPRGFQGSAWSGQVKGVPYLAATSLISAKAAWKRAKEQTP